MGMVVLRSTTPCVAVNSRSNSNLLTVISIVPAATAASTGIECVSPDLANFAVLLLTTLISNTNQIKPAVTVGTSQKWKTQPTRLFSPVSKQIVRVRNRSPTLLTPHCNSDRTLLLSSSSTTSTSHSQPRYGRLGRCVENS